jgi:hypothetical protein
MNALVSRKVTVAEYLVQRDLPADWRFGSPFGRVAARIYRTTYRTEPSRAFQFINGRFRRVMAYRQSELHVLAAAWAQYGSTAAARPAPAPRPAPVVRFSGDAMRWTPDAGPVRSHP